MAKRMKKQPLSILVACVVLALTSFVMLVAGGMTLTTATTATTTASETVPIQDPTGLMSYMPVAGILSGMGAIVFLLGILFGVFAYMLWTRNEMGWYGTVTLVGITLLVNVVMALFYGLAVSTPFLIGIALSIVVLACLLHKDTIKVINPAIKYNGWSI